MTPPTTGTLRSDRELDRRIVRQSGWVAVSYGGRQLATLLAMLVLVRLLEPEAFGLVALAWVFLTVLHELEGGGITAALIYRRDRIEEASASAFVFSVAASVALFGASFVAAPLIARAFHATELTDIVRVMALLLLFRGLGTVPAALVERRIDYRSRAKCEFTGALAQAGVSVGLAATGAGVWSLVIGQLVGAAVQTALFWIFVPWWPKLRLASLSEVRDLFRYGRFVGATNVLNLANNTLDNVFIGRLLGAGALGLYTVAFRIADFPNSVIGHVVGRVMFPVYSQLRGDVHRLRGAYLQNLQRTAFFALPLSVGVAIAAEPVVLGLLGERWEAAVTPLRILAVFGLVKTLFAPSGEVFKGIGKPQIGLAFGAAQTALLVGALALLAPRYGLTGAAWAMLVAVAVGGGAKLVASLVAVGATPGEIARAFAPPFVCSALVGVAVALLLPATDPLAPAAELAVLAAAGTAVYAGAAAVFARGVVAPIWAGWRGAGIGAAR